MPNGPLNSTFNESGFFNLTSNEPLFDPSRLSTVMVPSPFNVLIFPFRSKTRLTTSSIKSVRSPTIFFVGAQLYSPRTNRPADKHNHTFTNFPAGFFLSAIDWLYQVSTPSANTPTLFLFDPA